MFQEYVCVGGGLLGFVGDSLCSCTWENQEQGTGG